MIYGPLSEVLLDGRYRVGEVVGAGGFGTVYAAVHIGLGGKVAVKVPRVDDLAPSSIPGAIATFLEEGRTLKRLRHPGLAAALDIALLPPDAEGLALPYLVLEWCEGPTLKEWRAARPGPMSARDAWALLRPVFDAIAYAHDEGVAHRDIKPANILVETTRDGVHRPRVIDFGIAKILGGEAGSSGATRTTSAERAFTPRYAAPEQLTGMRTGPRTDVYALALVLCETIRGAPVFATDDDARRAVVESDLPTPRKLGLDLGSWNEPLALALSARPADRPADARTIMQALDDALDGAPREPRTSHPATDASPRGPVDRSAPRRAADDDSVVPSSHTLRTLGAPRTTKAATTGSPRMVAMGSGAMLLLAALAAIALLPLGGQGALRGRAVSPPSSAPADAAPRASADTAPTASTAPEAAARRLGEPPPSELIERAAAGGMAGCTVASASPALVDLACSNGRVARLDHGPPVASGRVWNLMEREAKAQAASGGAVRHTIDGTIGLFVVGPEPIVDAVTSHVLDGLRHEPVRKPPLPPAPAVIPARLSEWKGPELATRIRALGGIVQEEMAVLNVTTVLYRLDGKDAFAVHEYIDPKKGDAFLEGARRPYSFAVDGEIAIRSTGDDELSKIPHLKRILGTTTASRIVEHP
jgi:serine/threonine protein kinase